MNQNEKDLIELFKSKEILFLENDTVFVQEVKDLIIMFKKHNISHRCVFSLENLGFDIAVSLCEEADIIVFSTTWVTDISKKLKQYFLSQTDIKQKKTFVEIYIDKPTFLQKPKTIHDIYTLSMYTSDILEIDLRLL